MIGSFVGNYKITEKIGEGGMGAVFKGIDVMLERTVAVKVLRPELARQPEIVERFRTEAITLAKLNHPRIATLYNFFRHGDDFFMVMEFVPGHTLEKVICDEGPMHCDRALPLFCQALEGLDHAHSLGIIHRDIKPGNMMFTSSGSIKVMDFGIARVLGTGRMTKTGHLIGTIEYMSPEQVRGQTIDGRADLYSMGILLYEMLTGRVPFSSDSEYDLMKSQIEQAPPPPRGFSPNIPEFIEQAVLRALGKKPEERFATAGEFRTALLDERAHKYWGANYEPSAVAPKETRVATGGSAYAIPTDLKGTRLAQAADLSAHVGGSTAAFENHQADSPFDQVAYVQPGVPSGAAPLGWKSPANVNRVTPSTTGIFDGLNWKHYSGAAVVVLFFAFLAIGAIALIGLTGSKPLPANARPVASQTPASSSVTPAQSPPQSSPGSSASTPGGVIGSTEFVVPSQPPANNAADDGTRKKSKPARSSKPKSTGDDAESRRQKALNVLHKNR